jgi:hypothetical protein
VEKPMTKQAFSKARQKILPSAFSFLFDDGVVMLQDRDMIQTCKGWRVLAIDGTELQLPGYGETLRKFKHNSEHSLPHARASILCDVVSGFIAAAAIDTTARDERSLAKEHLEYFKPFYHLRWGVETKYNTLKNKFDIENFSGRTLVAIQQDFWATLYLSNVAAAMKLDAEEEIRERNKGKILKYEYKVNENILIGKLKNNLVMIFLEDDDGKRNFLFKKLMSCLSRCAVPAIPDRRFPRKLDSHKRIGNKPRKAL